MPPTDGVVATLIGDVVGSRRHPDRAALQRHLDDVLADVGQRIAALQPMAISVADEFQGVYARAGDALLAALLIRLELLPDIDTRYGVGWGRVEVFDAGRGPAGQDGPGWWAARDALEEVERRAVRSQSRHLRTWFADRSAETAQDVTHDASQGPRTSPTPTVSTVAGFATAFLSVRDDILAGMDERKLRLLRGLLRGSTQAELAAAEGITQPAVSQLLTRSGAQAVRLAHQQLDRALP